MDRVAREYAETAASLGHELEAHTGATGGRGSSALRRTIARADLVVVLTDINSHGALSLARRCAREEGKPIVLLRRCGATRLRELLGGVP